jgi:hypothetical protein
MMASALPIGSDRRKIAVTGSKGTLKLERAGHEARRVGALIAGSHAERQDAAMSKRLLIFVAAALVASCTGEESAAAPNARKAAAAAPAGAAIGRLGYATIRQAPPAPFNPAEAGTPAPLTPSQLEGHERMRRAGEFQNRVMDEVQALSERLRTAERDNFVDLYFENEGEPHVVFRFLRNPEATLAKYTKHPRFRAAGALYSREELRAAADFIWATFREDRVIQSVGIGNMRNRAEVEVAVSEPEFRALVARKGVRIPEAVELRFRATEPAAFVNRPLPPEIARLVRIFPRNDRPFGPLHAINSYARVILDDGCFRISGGKHDGALVLFPIGAQLFIDSRNYLAYGQDEAPGYARVGEELVFPGSISEATAPEVIRPIHAACDKAKVVAITGMQSAAADRAQQAATQNANALRQFRQSYGLSEAVARRVLDRCKQRTGFGTCVISPPPPPPPGGPSCPAGTKASFGMCRTPEGYIRPIPEWIQELMRE